MRFGKISAAQVQRALGFKNKVPTGPNAASKPLSLRSPAKPIAEPGSKHFSLNCAVYISEIEITSALTQIDRLSLKLLGDPWHDTYLEVDWMGRPDQTQTFIDWVLRSSGLYSSQYFESLAGYHGHYFCSHITDDADNQPSVHRLGQAINNRITLEDKLSCFRPTKGFKDQRDLIVVVDIDKGAVRAATRRRRAEEKAREHAEAHRLEQARQQARQQARTARAAARSDGMKIEPASWEQVILDSNNPPEIVDLSNTPGKAPTASKQGLLDKEPAATPSIEPYEEPRVATPPRQRTVSLSDPDDRLPSTPVRQRKHNQPQPSSAAQHAPAAALLSAKNPKKTTKRTKVQEETTTTHPYETRKKVQANQAN